MASTIGNALNFAFFSGEELEEQLLSYLQEKRLLLIVDNLEHLVQETDLLAKIMLRAPHVKMMTTSRERLNLRGEWVMEIQGMSYPHLRVSSRFVSETAVADTTSSLITTEWESYSAIKLFLQSAQQVCADFEPTEVDKLHIVQICQLVEGIPLAIELAASWVRVLACAEIAREIEHNYEFLATSWRDVPERHRSLQAVFDYSWDLLSPSERQMIRKLSVFQRGFHREAALRVAGASLLLLSALVDKSFLKPTRHGTSGVRYEIHDLLRQYAEEKLNVIEAEREEAHSRHAYYFADFLYQRESDLQGSRQTNALEEIGEEIENIRAGWHWMLENQLADGLDKYVESLFQFYDIRSWSQEGLEAFDTAVRILVSSDDEETQISLGKLLSRQGRFCYRLGQTSKARQILQQSLTLLEQFDVPTEEAFALNQLAYVAYRLGDHEQAMDLCQRSLALSRPLQANWQTAESLQILGEVVNVQGDYDEAKKIHQEGLQISKTLGDQRGLAVALNQIGYLDWRLGNYDEAWQSCEESLEICREVGDRRGIAMCHKNLGNIASELDDHLRAQRHYRRGLRISQEIGHTWGEAAFLNNLASEAWELAEYERAKELGEKSLAIWRKTGYQLGMASTLETLGTIVEAMDLYEESKAYFLEALAITLDIGTRPLSLDILGGLGILLAKAGDIARAVEVLTFVLNHPMSDQETKVKVGRRLPQFISQLSPEAFALAEAKSLQVRFEQIVAGLLNQ
jgi:predicted ATPase/Tfp pilus assembly protein PilF